MSEAKKRKVHTPEFKSKVGLEALRGVQTINGSNYIKVPNVALLQKLIMTQEHHELSGLIVCKCQIVFQSDGFLL